MGVGGLGLMWREAARVLGVPGAIGGAVLLATALAWVAIAAGHAARALRHPDAVRAELASPVRAPFAGAASIGLMLVAAFLIPHAPGLAAALWAGAVALHLLIAALLVRRILLGGAEPAMLAPPLLLPLVGNILPPYSARSPFAPR
jgi:tellurite resistance protein